MSIGIGSFSGLSSGAYALGPLQLPAFTRPDIAEFGWTIAIALAIALVDLADHAWRAGDVCRRGKAAVILAPAVGLIVAGLAIAFSQATSKSVDEVLFSGQDALAGLVAHAGSWSLSALALLIAFKGLGYALSLGSFRGGPTFPAVFLGTAAGIMASRLPGFPLTPAVAVGMGAAVVAVLRLPLSAVVLATLLTNKGGSGAEPLIIVGVVVAYIVTVVLSEATTAKPADGTAAPAAAGAGLAVTAVGAAERGTGGA